MSDATSIEQRLAALESAAAQHQAFVAQHQAFVAQHEALAAQWEQERGEYRKLISHLREENERLRRGLLGQKAERLPKDDAQLSLAVLNLAMQGQIIPPAPPEPDEQVVAEHTRRRPARKAAPADLPRVVIELVPDEVQDKGRDAFECIGVEKREVLERRPASTVVVEVRRLKFVAKDRERNAPTEVIVGESLELPIERGTAGPGLLAETIVRRWQDHLPLNRLEAIYAREGLDLARSTICTWHEGLVLLGRPLVGAMFEDALAQPYLCTDATGVLVQAPDRCRHGHFWVLVAPERHVLFQFSKRHDSEAVDRLLPGYRGYLVADGHAVYDHLYRTGAVTEVGCWAHCRRYFFKAMPSDPDRGKTALSYIAALFSIERDIAGLPRKKRREARLARAKPIVDAFFAWCDAEAPKVLDESPISDGIRYARNQRAALQRFLDDAQLPIHNNISEFNLRRQAVGRKNWLFVGSEDGAEANTIFVSLLASCRMHGIEPHAYLRDILCLLPSWPKNRLLELAPVNWKQTCEQPDTKQLLDDNVFRRVALGRL